MSWSSSTPAQVKGLESGAAELTAGYAFTCGRTSGGDVRCWGRNYYGQIGDGTETNRGTPTPVAGLQGNAAAVAAGWHHVCAVTANGAVRCWGDSADGRLGDGTVTRRLTPTAAPGLANGIRGITVGTSHTCALNAAGGARCWGDNAYRTAGRRHHHHPGSAHRRDRAGGWRGRYRCVGQPLLRPDGWRGGPLLGLQFLWPAGGRHGRGPPDASSRRSGSAAESRQSGWGAATPAPSQQAGPCSAGGRMPTARSETGTTTNRPTPVPVSGLSGAVAAIAVGAYHACALTTSGGVVCWGSNYEGGLGDGTTDDRSVPAPVSGLASGVSAISAGLYHSCALMTSGAVRCWGSNSFAQLGDGTTVNRVVPTDVVGLDHGVASISAGAFNTCAVRRGRRRRLLGLQQLGSTR